MELKNLRRELKQHGYKIRTKTLNSLGGKRFADVYKDKEFIVGSSANVYSKDTIEEHQVAFDIYNAAEKRGVTDKGQKIIL